MNFHLSNWRFLSQKSLANFSTQPPYSIHSTRSDKKINVKVFSVHIISYIKFILTSSEASINNYKRVTLMYSHSHIAVKSVTYCSIVGYILLYIRSHISVQSNIAVQWVTYCCTVSYVLLYSKSHIAVQSVTYCCTVSHILLYSRSHIAVQSVTYCCTISHILLYSRSHIALQLVTYCCTVGPHIAVQSVTYCCTVSHIFHTVRKYCSKVSDILLYS